MFPPLPPPLYLSYVSLSLSSSESTSQSCTFVAPPRLGDSAGLQSLGSLTSFLPGHDGVAAFLFSC